MTETYYLFAYTDGDNIGWQIKKLNSLNQIREELNNFLDNNYFPKEIKIQQITTHSVTLNFQFREQEHEKITHTSEH